MHNLLFTRISVLLRRLIWYIKVFWNKVKYMCDCCIGWRGKSVPLQDHCHQWVCHLESQCGKSAIYYFPVDDMRHGRPINARGPNVSISITLPPHKIRPFLPSLGWRPYSMLVKKFENLSNSSNFPKIVQVFVFGEHPLPCCVFSSFFLAGYLK